MKQLIIITLFIIVAIVLFLALPWIILCIGLYLSPAPPSPKITYAEFPFRLEYEINGQREVIEDTLICEYAGIGINEGIGKYHEWTERLASGKERITLLKISDTQEIWYRVGHARYYMGALGPGGSYHHPFPNAEFLDLEKEKKGEYYETTLHAEELLEKFNIKLIHWDYTEPITQEQPETK